jgi:site-specific recombinase XerD
LWLWKETTRYAGPDDWIFASPRAKGKKPFYPDMAMVKHIRPAALRAGIMRTIGWHTFRHTYSTMLIANGEKVKVVQELDVTLQQSYNTSGLFTGKNQSQARSTAATCGFDPARRDTDLDEAKGSG